MKRVSVLLALFVVASAVSLSSESSAKPLAIGHRDTAGLDRHYPAPCLFPPVANPCAAPCRPPGIQCQSVPCAVKTACPSSRLPCHGVSYGDNPYPLFQ